MISATLPLLESRAADLAAPLLETRVYDYAAVVISLDGKTLQTGAGYSTWLALLRACEGDNAQASRLADGDISDTWRSIDGDGDFRMQVRAIDDKEGNPIGFLFK